MKRYFVFVMLLCCAAFAQTPAPQSAAKADTVSRTTKAVNYRHKGGATKIDFRGTELMQTASGEGKVESKNGHIEIDVQLDGIEDATKFGLEYLTYVLWAISPQGRPVNLGEALLDHGRSRVRAVTELQTFGMIVTAEPYFAVTQPGNMVVMENVVRSDTAGRQENIDARYELIGRGNYSSSNAPIRDAIFGIDRKTPLDLFQARNAVRIAHLAGADKYAPAIMVKAQQQLSQAEDAYRLKRGKSAISTAARETAETCEEARVISLKQKAEEDAQARSAADRKAAEEREAKARADAQAEGRRRADAEAARAQAEAARAQAEAARSDAERMKREAEAAAQEASRQKQEADAAKAAALAQQEQLAAEAEKARNAAQEADRLRQQAEKEKADLRARLLQQLNSILSTRDTARGLIANMSDVLFETGKYELRAEARERLAKVSGIVLAYPSLHLDVEGHTDSVGSDEYNQQLSEFRAQSVRNYLVQEGVAPNSIAARGLGKTQPIASNDTAEGRQKNRRVELVLSGDAIGMNVADAQPVAQSGATPRR
jgi:outer membrane protein OmpA-like peptidoglycan-associated protein